MARIVTLLLCAAGCGEAAAEQPLPFGHAVHVAKHKMACVECHVGVETRVWAGLPTADDCLRCHAMPFSEKPRALEVTKKAPSLPSDLPWVRLLAIAPHAHVSHAAHVAAKVPCEKCHGGTGKSEVSRREMMLRGEALMYWCVECHEEKKASTECLTCHR